MSAPGPLIYLDHNATAPLLPEVQVAVAKALAETWGNPSSVHQAGRRARTAIEAARAEVAALLGATSEEVVFTSGGTEGNHLAIRGLAGASSPSGSRPGGERDCQPRRLISSRLEHPSVQGALECLIRDGHAARWLSVDEQGGLDIGDFEQALGEGASLVSLALVNHEIGNVYPIPELARRARDSGALVHTDAVQALGRLPIDVATLGVDALTLSSHKIGGPKGVGAIWVRRGLESARLMPGGHQERERRAGTENVPGIVGFGLACRLTRQGLADRVAKVARLRDRLERRLLAIPGSRVHGRLDSRAPGVSNLGFTGASGQFVVIGLDLEGVAASTGAACSSGSLSPSPALLALGLTAEKAREAIRLSLGPENTEDEIDRAAAIVERVVARVRASA